MGFQGADPLGWPLECQSNDRLLFDYPATRIHAWHCLILTLEWASSYFMPRETVQPPPLLLGRVWPDLDRWQAVYLERPDACKQVEPNLAAGGFLELLQRLHSVFLQVYISIAVYNRGSKLISSL